LREEIPVRPRDLKAIDLASAGRNVAGRKKGRRVNAQLRAIGKQDGGFVRTDARFEQIARRRACGGIGAGKGIVGVAAIRRISRDTPAANVGLSEPQRTAETEPIEPRRLDDLLEHLGAGILKVCQGASAGVAAGHHGIRNALANFVTVLVRRNPFADLFQGCCHVGDGVLVKFGQHFASRPI